ncbi:MAG: type I DNA topoisomerase [Patescibacteria group bacterium]
MKLVIVESPTKAKTITKFLGKDFTVKSSYGHVRDLPTKELGVDIKNDFLPTYIIPGKAADRVRELKRLAKKSGQVILATDEDREGEAIAWHLAEALELDAQEAERIVFHEITKTAIQEALENPRKINLSLVDAQQARRVLDRLVGYKLSPFLWKKVRRGLSAGRVQSVALRFIVEREREIEKFPKENFFDFLLKLKKGSQEFEASLLTQNGQKIEKTATHKLFAGDYKSKATIFTDRKSAEEVLSDLQKSKLQVSNVERKETTRNPLPPFTTSTLQQSAINKLGFSSKQTMSVAQKLYEKGLITYMRTDSTNLSMQSLLSATKTITEKFGKEYALPTPRFFTKKSKGSQEAHEAIRPSYPEKTPEVLEGELERNEFRLYDLIWKRMIACQMTPAVFDSLKISVEAKEQKNTYELRASGSVLKFDGFLRVMGKGEDVILPEMKTGDDLDFASGEVLEKTTSAPPRYNEATLVKVLEENGIGRPSTYAPTISTIFERKYIEKNEEKRLYPLEIGFLVTDILVEHFPQIVNVGFTVEIEEDLDEIAEGKNDWVPVIRNFYEPFEANLKTKTKEVKKEDFQEVLEKKCPKCGGDLIMKFGRFGKFIACSKYPECKYTEKTAEEKKQDEAAEGETCEKCGAPMVVKRGRFGAFLGCSKYPECKNIRKIEKKTGLTCPKCGKGEIVERKSKRGRLFYGCNAYPNCDFALWNKPTGENCPKCQAPMTFAAKGKEKCSSKECGFEK